MDKIKNIIFDLGGVILNIDYQLTANAFKNLGISDYDKLYTQFQQIDVFDKLETGKISPKEFYKQIRELSGINISDKEIEDAWNAMLLDFPVERLEFLSSIKNKYRLFLCSNTNEIHLKFYNKVLQDTFGISSLGDIMEKEYYSHIVEIRKPDKEIFELIIDENKLTPAETLFIDDSPQHIEGAKLTGLQTIHLQAGMSILDLGL